MDPGELEEAVVDGVKKAVSAFLHSTPGIEAFERGVHSALLAHFDRLTAEAEKRRIALATGPQPASIQPPCSPSSSP